MPPISWNEIRQRAITFSRQWSDAAREQAESQTFWNEFFEVFGKSRRAVAAFEHPVRNLCGNCLVPLIQEISTTTCHTRIIY